MSRRRPELENWDDRRLRQITNSNPETWVGTVLNTFVPTKMRNGPLEKPRVWTFGEIREAIRRELVRRNHPEPKASHLASLRTLRGLKALREEDALDESPRGYSIRRRWYWAEAISDIAHDLADGRSKLSIEAVHLGPGAHSMTVSFRDKKGRCASATVPIENR